MRGMVQLAGALMMGFVLTVPVRADEIGTVFYIALENHNFTQPSSQDSPQQLYGNPAAPYLNSLITPGNPNAAQSSYASAYTNVPGIHPSEPNYVWQEAGLAGPLNDNDPFPNNIVNAPNFRGLLQNAGISWKSYQEDIDLTKNSQGQLTNTVLPQSQWTVPLTSLSGTSSSYTNPYNGSNQYNLRLNTKERSSSRRRTGVTTRHPRIPRPSTTRHCSNFRPTWRTILWPATTGSRPTSTMICTVRLPAVSLTMAFTTQATLPLSHRATISCPWSSRKSWPRRPTRTTVRL